MNLSLQPPKWHHIDIATDVNEPQAERAGQEYVPKLPFVLQRDVLGHRRHFPWLVSVVGEYQLAFFPSPFQGLDTELHMHICPAFLFMQLSLVPSVMRSGKTLLKKKKNRDAISLLITPIVPWVCWAYHNYAW